MWMCWYHRYYGKYAFKYGRPTQHYTRPSTYTRARTCSIIPPRGKQARWSGTSSTAAKPCRSCFRFRKTLWARSTSWRRSWPSHSTARRSHSVCRKRWLPRSERLQPLRSTLRRPSRLPSGSVDAIRITYLVIYVYTSFHNSTLLERLARSPHYLFSCESTV